MPNSPTIKLVDFEDKIKLPGDDRVYDFNMQDFDFQKYIYTGFNRIKEMYFEPGRISMSVKFITIHQGTSDKDIRKRNSLKEEIQNLRQLSDFPYLVDFYGVCIFHGEALLCMELMDLSLKDFYVKIHSNNCRFPEKIIGIIFVNVVKALNYCNHKHVIHRDVKPANILINRNGEVKMADFGSSKNVEFDIATSLEGTINYMAPEKLLRLSSTSESSSNPSYNFKSDIWSTGISILEIASGNLPITIENTNESYPKENQFIDFVRKISNISQEEVSDMVKIHLSKYSEEIKSFVSCCLHDEENRPDYKTLMSHKFYTSNNMEDNNKSMAVFIKKNLNEFELLNGNNDSSLDDIKICQQIDSTICLNGIVNNHSLELEKDIDQIGGIKVGNSA